MRKLSIVALMIVAGAAQAQVVIPPAFAGTSTGTSGFNTVMRQFERSMQAVYSAGQLTGVNVGDQITGIQFRMFFTASNPATFPVSALSFANYDIFLGQSATAPGSMSTTYAANQGAGFMQVRSGGLTVNPNTYVKGPDIATPAPWGELITFTTPYTYTGGSLLMELRHTGNGSTTGNLFVDTVADSAGNWQAIAQTAAGAYTATTGVVGATAAPVMRLTVVPVPEPATMAILGLGAAALLRRRRK